MRERCVGLRFNFYNLASQFVNHIQQDIMIFDCMIKAVEEGKYDVLRKSMVKNRKILKRHWCILTGNSKYKAVKIKYEGKKKGG